MNTQLRKFYELTDEGQGGSPTAAQKEARRIVDMFYLCMPFKDVKLTDCGENKKLIIKMEMLSAKQCAILHVRGIIESKPMLPHEGYCELWQDRADDALSHWQSILSEIEKM